MSTLQQLLDSNSSKSSKEEKTQSQINKCLNEKRRREQENVYIEELAELISANVADMSSFYVKPDKCAILQETVNQIRQIKQEETGQPEAVQQSQVSSSKPSILANDVLGPLLLEALDGFLFVVNSQTKVDFVSENVNQYLKYSQEDLVGKSIYNIIHVGDHTQFSTSLRPVSLAVGGACIWPADSAANKSRTFNCRMLIKPPGDEDDLELKQTQVVQYENMQITAVLQPYPSDKDADSTSSESQSCLVCIARRLGFVEKTNSMLGVEQFTTKEDLSGKIVACDTSGIQPSTYNYPDFVGQNIQEFVHINDVQLLSKHHHEVLKNGTSTSGVYRFKLQENRYVFVQTKSKLFNNPSSNKPEFIMSTHSIIRECDSDIELKGSASTSLMKSIIGQGGKPRDQDLSSLMQTFHSQNINKELMTRGLMTGMETLSSLGSMSPGVMGLDSNQFDINPLVQGDMAPNLDDVLDLLANPSSWDSNKNVRGPVIGSSTTTFTAPGPSLPVNAPVNTPTTRVSWSNVNLGLIQQPHTTQTRTTPQAIPSSVAQPFPGQPRRPMPPNFQGRNMMNMEKGPMSPSFMAQRSPGFSGQKSPGYNMNLRSPSPMMNQRSPASTSGAAAFPQPRTPSMMSPSPVPPLGSPALNNAGWQQSTGRASQKSPLQALQSMEAQAGGPEQRTVTMNLPYMGMMPPTSLQEKMKHMDKSQLIKELAMTASVENQQLEHRNQLRQLLTRDLEQENKKPSPEALPQTSSAHQAKERPSPQPSSTFLDQPQSTCLDGLQEQNGEDGSQKDGNQEHTLLKQLLSQEEETEVPKLAKQDMSLEAVLTSTDSGDELQNPDKNEAEAKSGGSPMKVPQEANAGERKAEDGNDKNEAEPKKMDNYLLKALLNNESAEAAGSDSKEQKKNQTALLQKLLQDDEEQTREAKPKDPNTMDMDQVDTSSAQEVNRLGSHEMAREMVNTSMANMRPADSGLSRLLQIAPMNAIPGVDKEKLLQGNNLENFLSDMWDKQTEENERGIKRKAEGQDPSVHSTDVLVESNNPSDQGPSQMAKKNVLLARLLSKTATKEAVINTQHTVNPSSTPQTSLPKNLADKIIDVLPTRPQDIGASAMETIQTPNAWDNPRTDPNTPFPGNTSKDTTGLNMAGNNTVPGLPRSTSDTPGAGGLDVQLQQLLNQPINPATPSQGARNTPPTSLGGNTNNGSSSDPFLSQILQQATDLQQDCTNTSASPLKFDQPMTDDSNLLQQLEQALKTSNISLAELDSFLGINSAGSPQFNTLDMNEQMAIDAIQQQLMSVEPQTPASASTPMPTSVGTPTVSSPMSVPASQTGNGATSPFLQAQAQAQVQAQAQNSMSELRHQLQQQTNCFNQTNLIGFNQQQQQQQQQQGPRFQQPQGLQGMGASLNQMDFAGGQTTTAMHVRQSLLLKQKQKQMREQQQTRLRLQQQQERRLLLQQQRQQQFSQQQQQQQFMQGNMGLDGLPGPSLPENFSELMNTSMAPNVSLQYPLLFHPSGTYIFDSYQRNQSIPGPMSPRFVGAGMQQQQGLGQMIRNPNRASPFTSQGQPGWNQRPSMLQGMQQNPQFSGVQRTPGVPQEGSRFRFTDSQFTGGQQLGMIGGQTQQPQPQPQQQPQQQQVFNQNRMVQRAPMPQIQGGMQSPRGQRSPYGNQEALQMSPHAQKLSPNAQATPTPQQLTPPYPQMPMSSGNLSVSPGNLPVSPMNSQPGFPASMASFDPPSSMYTNSLSQERKAQLGAGGTMTTATSTTSQYVKQEIRAICNARSQNQQMSTSSVDSGLSLGFDGGEIPMDVLESLDQLTRQQLSNQGPSQLAGQGMATPQPGGGPQQAEPTASDMPFQDDLLNQTREEAKRRYEKFQALSSTDADDPELRASNLFRNQLITSPSAKSDGNGPRPKKPGGPKMDLPSVSVVQPEPRAQLEEVKPADQKNSLLQQLLSEN